jgi:hypothetical protein
MVQVKRGDLKARRTRGGGWETYEDDASDAIAQNDEILNNQPIALRIEPDIMTEEVMSTEKEQEIEVEAEDADDALDADASNEEQPEKPVKKGFWKRFKSLFNNSNKYSGNE